MSAARGAALPVVQGLYRLLKSCLLHTDANQAVQAAIAPAIQAVRELCEARSTDSVVLLFSGDMVFVDRRLLRAPQETYALALQLGAWLATCQATELTLPRSPTADGLRKFARFLADAQRDKQRAAAVDRTDFGGITIRDAPPLNTNTSGAQIESGFSRVVKTYATAALIVDRMRAAIDRGEPPDAQELKRVAQKLVALGEDYQSLLIALAAAPLDGKSRGRQLLGTAVIALAMARRATSDRGLLVALAQAALLDEPDGADLGRRVLMLSELGGFQPGAVRRAVLAADSSMAANDERTTSTLSALLSCARKLNSLRADGADLDAALSALGDGPIARLLAAVLGVLPPGTAVELNTGEVAIVTARARRHLDVLRPRVRLLTDARGDMLEAPAEIDLARPLKDAPLRWVKSAANRP